MARRAMYGTGARMPVINMGMPERSKWYIEAVEHLVDVVQRLSCARDVNAVANIVRSAARELTGADGATFVLRDEDRCFYLDEDAIGPLWKGQKFPMTSCVSGWVMKTGKNLKIPDIYQDDRIPIELYKPTFVKSMVMVPIRSENPVGAIGIYWAENRIATDEEISILQSIAHVTSVAMENSDLYAKLQCKIQALEKSNSELERFAWVASHDLKSPLRAIDHLAQWVEEDLNDRISDKGREHLQSLRQRVRRMNKLLDDLLDYAHLESVLNPKKAEVVDGGVIIQDIKDLVEIPPGFSLEFSKNFQNVLVSRLPVQQVLCNLISNAFKHHDRDSGCIEVSVTERSLDFVFSVKDDGPGISEKYHNQIFNMFQTLKPRDHTEGSGMGLALAKKIVEARGHNISVSSSANERGTTFSFSWPKDRVC